MAGQSSGAIASAMNRISAGRVSHQFRVAIDLFGTPGASGDEFQSDMRPFSARASSESQAIGP
jgi:hypothetical protein